MKARVILVKVQYKEQVWYDLKEVTMGLTHGKYIQQSSPNIGEDTGRKDSEADSL